MIRGRRKLGQAAACALALAGLAVPAAALGDAWTTYHRDAARTGLVPDAATATAPGPSWTSPQLDGSLFGEPLVYGSLVYVATENNSVFALDAATGAIVWQRYVGTPVPATSPPLPCTGTIHPTIGITSTPVIDPATNGIYAVAETWDGANAHHVLVGYDLATGAALMSRTVDPAGMNAAAHLQRPALALDGDRVVIGFGGPANDCGIYHGWLVAAKVDGSSQLSYEVPTTGTTPDGPDWGGAIWGSGDGPALDAAGNIYATTGNGNSFDPNNYDSGNSILKFDQGLNRLDSFAPASWVSDNQTDLDLGSANPLLLPDGLLFQGSKNGNAYLVSSASLGHSDQGHFGTEVFSATACGPTGATFGAAAYAGATVYLPCDEGLKAFAFGDSPPSLRALWQFTDANGPPIVAAGLVWVVHWLDNGVGGALYGLDPGAGDAVVYQPLAAAEHFTSPSVAGGQLFVSTGHSVSAFGIARLAQPPGSTSPTPAPPAAAARRPDLAVVIGRHLHARGGRVRLRLKCPAAAPKRCAGTVAIRLYIVFVSAARRKAPKRRVHGITLASGRFSVPVGRTRTVKPRLTPAGRGWLRGRRRPLHVAIVVTQRVGRHSRSASTAGTLAPR